MANEVNAGKSFWRQADASVSNVNRRKPETGFFLMETVVLGIIVLAVAAVMQLYPQAAALSAGEGTRQGAVFLARQQLAYVSQKADAQKQLPAEISWQGETSDLQRGNTSYRVTTTCQPSDTGVYTVTVEVNWQNRGRDAALTLKKEVIPLDREAGK